MKTKQLEAKLKVMTQERDGLVAKFGKLIDRMSAFIVERNEAVEKYNWMLNAAGDSKLEGYRELAAKLAEAEIKCEEFKGHWQCAVLEIKNYAKIYDAMAHDFDEASAKLLRVEDLIEFFEDCELTTGHGKFFAGHLREALKDGGPP